MPPQPSRYPAPLLQFPTQAIDYRVIGNRLLGSGRFSTVYLAQPLCPFTPQSSGGISTITPPTTPTNKGFTTTIHPSPQLYAVKIPADQTSVTVLRSEANILSYLMSFRDACHSIVPFHGLDPRNNALVLSVAHCSLDDLITTALVSLPEETRTATVASLLPSLAHDLTTSLRWLHSTDIVHADIKPANILLQSIAPIPPGASVLSVPFTPLFADFSSAFHATRHSPATAPALGGGTYDYLAPELLKRPYPDSTFPTDIWALAMTLLVFIIGDSPYATAANRYQKLDWVKKGHPLAFVNADPLSLQRIASTAMLASAMDIISFLDNGLKQNPEERRLA